MAKDASSPSEQPGKDGAQRGPAPRPALRKSVDAELHPALAGKAPGIGRRPPGAPLQEDQQDQSGKKGQGKPGKGGARSGGKAAAAVPGPAPAWTTRGGTAADAVRPTKKDPPVTITVTLPKSMRKRLRQAARARGVEPEALAAELLAERLQHDF